MHVFLCRESDLKVEDVCPGPTPGGGCPYASEGAPVRCAGRRIIVNDEQGPSYVFSVEATATACPVAAFAPPWSAEERSRADASAREEANDHDG